MTRLSRAAPLLALTAQAAIAPAGMADPLPDDGFIAGSRWSLLNRTVYDQRDYRHGARSNGARNALKPFAERNGYAEEWAYGLMGRFQSGFTAGTVGIGLDVHVHSAIQLDSGGGRAGKARLLGLDDDRRPNDEMTRAGAALKLRTGPSTLVYGEQRVKTPVFGSSNSRLLPETATGWLLDTEATSDTRLLLGHFTESTDRNASSHDKGFVVNYSNAEQGDRLDFVGLVHAGDRLSASLFGSRYEDTWTQHYLGLAYRHPLGDDHALAFALHGYRTTDTGQALSGRIDNTAWSLSSSYLSGPHRFTLGYQHIDGDTPFDYVTRGAIYLGNAAQLSDFNAPNERSWQLRYDLSMAGFGLPGLSFSAAYLHGHDIDGRDVDPSGGYAYLGYGTEGEHWERDLEARYVMQDGAAKGLMVSLRHSVHRGNTAQAELDADQLRLAVEWPLGGAL